MRFVPQKKGRLKAILSPEDMDSFGVTYSQMDYGDVKTRRLLAWVLESARRQTGFRCPESTRLLIELFPVLKGGLGGLGGLGGCVIVFTILEQMGTERPAQRAEEVFVFAFSPLEPLGQAAAALAGRSFPRGCRCALYRLGEEYRIVCHLPRPLRDLNEHPCRRELLRRGRCAGTGELAEAYCEEHGTLLAPQNALEKLAVCWK